MNGIFYSAEIDKLMPALLAVQNERVIIEKDAKSYTNKYTSLDNAIRTAQPILSKHGLVITQDYGNIDGSPAIITTVCHVESGQLKITALPFDRAGMSKVNAAQDYFAGSSYARRYAYLGAIGWASGDDTDGNFGQDSGKKKAAGKSGAMPDEVRVEIERTKDVDDLTAVCAKWKGDAKSGGWAGELGSLFNIRKSELEQ